MESGDAVSINTEPPKRRITRQSSKEPGFVLKPREPLRRRRRDAEPQVDSVTVVNGSENQERLQSTDDDDDDNYEPPTKRRSMQSTEDEDADADIEMQADGDDQEPDNNDDIISKDPQLVHLIKKSSVPLVQLNKESLSKYMGVQVEPRETGVVLRSRRSIYPTMAGSGIDTEVIKHSTGSSKKDSGASVISSRLPPKRDSRTGGQTVRSSMKEYQRKLLDGGLDHIDFARTSQRVMDLNQTPNNILLNNKLAKNRVYPEVVSKQKAKTSDKGGRSGISTVILWLFLLCVSLSVGVLAYQRIPWSSLLARFRERMQPISQEASLGVFSNHMRALEQHFRSQRDELWRRSRIHLQRHLQAAEHTEPVSVILTGGRQAEGTLRCLATRLALAFSSAVNGSVLELDGVSLADKDSSQVKLDLDNQLREAFEGDKPAAVIHRLEELPPSSTLIFYRYCDHESAAYKHPLLIFTVLLPQEDIGPEVGLPEVEELVHGHVHQKFLVPDQPDSFDKMDVNKLSGLWSRISHLVLPVRMEQHVEEGGCGKS